MGQLDITLYLENPDIEQTRFEALTGWCHKHSCRVKCLESRTVGPVLYAAMAGFHPQWSVLTRLVLDLFPKKVLSQLVNTSRASSEFNLLTWVPSTSLQVLQYLPKLTDLELAHGRFYNLDAAVHLTKLVLILCRASYNQSRSFVDTLVELRLLRNAFLAHFHRDGVAACRCLQSLECCGRIYDIDTGESLSLCFWEARIPSNLSALTALTALQFEVFCQDVSGVGNLDWLTNLRSLQYLKAAVHTGLLMLPDSISMLSCLKQLHIQCGRVPNDKKHMILDFDWTALQLLEKVTIFGQVHPSHQLCLSGLLQLDRLKQVALPKNIGSEPLEHLVTRMRLDRPDVLLQFHDLRYYGLFTMWKYGSELRFKGLQL